MPNRRPSATRALAALAAFALLAPAGYAQAPEPTPTPEVPKLLEEVTVTAQKREENIQDIPLSVTSLDADKLSLLYAGAADVKALSARVPSLLLESSFGRAFPRFYIRGLGNTDFDLNASQPVSMIVDEIVLENPVVKGKPLFDLQRTEVLRGPQGSLFGRNTPAGIVKFETVKPSRELDGFARVSYGTYDNVDFKGAVGGPLSDTVSARVSLLYQQQSDWIENTFTGEEDALGGHDTWAFRGQLLWEPNERFSALLKVDGWSLDGTARIFRANILQKGSNDLVSGYRQDQVAQDGLNEQDIDAFGGALKVEYDLGEATLSSITGFETLEMYSRGDIDGGFGAVFAPPSGPGLIPFPSESADGLPKLDQFTQELRVASKPGGAGLRSAPTLQGGTEGRDLRHARWRRATRRTVTFQTQDGEVVGAVRRSTTTRGASLKGGLRYTTDEKDLARSVRTRPSSSRRRGRSRWRPTPTSSPGTSRRRTRRTRT